MTFYILLLVIFTFLVTFILFVLSVKTRRPAAPQASDSNTCPVCKREIEGDEETIKCQCGKSYHEKCAVRAEVCPNCMKPLLSAY